MKKLAKVAFVSLLAVLSVGCGSPAAESTESSAESANTATEAPESEVASATRYVGDASITTPDDWEVTVPDGKSLSFTPPCGGVVSLTYTSDGTAGYGPDSPDNELISLANILQPVDENNHLVRAWDEVVRGNGYSYLQNSTFFAQESGDYSGIERLYVTGSGIYLFVSGIPMDADPAYQQIITDVANTITFY